MQLEKFEYSEIDIKWFLLVFYTGYEDTDHCRKTITVFPQYFLLYQPHENTKERMLSFQLKWYIHKIIVHETSSNRLIFSRGGYMYFSPSFGLNIIFQKFPTKFTYFDLRVIKIVFDIVVKFSNRSNFSLNSKTDYILYNLN